MSEGLIALLGVVVGAVVTILSPFLMPFVNRWERRRLRRERQLIESWKEIYRCAEKVRDIAYLRLKPGDDLELWTQSDQCYQEFHWMHWYLNDPHPVKIAHTGLNEAWVEYRKVAVEVVNRVFQEHRLPDEEIQERVDLAQARLGSLALKELGGIDPIALEE